MINKFNGLDGHRDSYTIIKLDQSIDQNIAKKSNTRHRQCRQLIDNRGTTIHRLLLRSRG